MPSRGRRPRPPRRPLAPGPILLGLVAAIVLLVVAYLTGLQSTPGAATGPGTGAGTPGPGRPGSVAEVERVVDGDTVIVRLAGQRERVRLLNIDTPESVAEDQPVECLGPEAADFTADLLPEGAEVTLIFDEEPRDQYGRMLAAIMVEGRNASVELARAGLAYPVTFPPNDRFRPDVDAAVAVARAAAVGLWEPGGCP
ncbi:MAG: nuclease (SNase domain protein) [Naasia sp.]|nr:nuclease (SNase domain protein) [Naasia sp.]